MPDWKSVLRTVFVSRALDALEETRLVPGAQGALPVLRPRPRPDPGPARPAADRHARRRRSLLPLAAARAALGLSAEEALASTMMRAEGMSRRPRHRRRASTCRAATAPCLLPACGGVGTQYTPATGWAQSLVYRARVLKDAGVAGSIAVAHGGEASTATNGFWASLNIATTERLPLLYFIEDNGYGISVPAPRRRRAATSRPISRPSATCRILAGDGSDPIAAAGADRRPRSTHVRDGRRARCCCACACRAFPGTPAQDTQAYKSAEEIAAERARDPLAAAAPAPRARAGLRSRLAGARGGGGATRRGGARAHRGAAAAFRRRPSRATRSASGAPTVRSNCSPRAAAGRGHRCRRRRRRTPRPDGARINMLTAIRRTLEHELAINPRVLVFGEDVGRKGGVHAATLGLQERFGEDRVFDTSLSEEGIIGRAVGMALAGLDAGARDPVPQVRRARGGAAARLRHDPLAHGEPLRGADGRAHAGRILQVRRSLAQPVQRSAVRCTRSAGSSRCRRTRRTPSACCARRCAATIR